MIEHKPGTLPYIVEKWKPMTDDLVGHPAAMTAWAMEHESRYLRSPNDLPTTPDKTIKCTFPVIRRTIEVLTADGVTLTAEISPHVVREVTAESYEAVIDAMHDVASKSNSSLENAVVDEVVAAVTNMTISAMALRLHSYIAAFPE